MAARVLNSPEAIEISVFRDVLDFKQNNPHTYTSPD